jgi:transposase
MTQQKFRRLPSDLTDQEWELIRRLLPPPPATGRPRADDRKTINGILYVLKTGCRWEDIPPERYGSGKTCWKRFDRWQKEGVWHAIEKLLILELSQRRKLNLTNAYLDTSIRQNKRGAKTKSVIRDSRRKMA